MFRAICLGLLMYAALPAAAQRPAAEYVCIERLSERVLVAYWLGTGRCNLTAIQTQKGLVIIDTEISPRVMSPIKARIEKEFGRSDWAYVINTHAHMHHAGGNAALKPAVVVAHENMPEDIRWLVHNLSNPASKRKVLANTARTVSNLNAVLSRLADNPADAKRIRGELEFWRLYGQDVRDGFEVVKPAVIFADRHRLDCGDVRLEMVFFGRGHSLSDTLVYIPEEKLLVTGAIAYQRNHLPEVSEKSQMKDVQRFLAVLDEFLSPEVQVERIVPSHSPPLVKSDLRPVRGYYELLLTGLRDALREGLTLEQAKERFEQRKAFPTFYLAPPGEWDHGMHDRNITNLWRILKEEGSALGVSAPR